MLSSNSFHHSNCFKERCRYVFVLLAPSVKEMLKPSEFPWRLCYFLGGHRSVSNGGVKQSGQRSRECKSSLSFKAMAQNGKRMRRFTELLNEHPNICRRDYNTPSALYDVAKKGRLSPDSRTS